MILLIRMKVVVGDGFEPSKAKPADLQSAPVGHLGNLPTDARPHSKPCHAPSLKFKVATGTPAPNQPGQKSKIVPARILI